MLPRVCLVSALLAVSAVPAAAAVTVMGGGMARECSAAAFAERSDDQALAACTMALEQPMPPRQRAGTFVNRGVLLLRRKDFAGAVLDFNTALRVLPDLGEAYVNRGAAQIAQRRFREGVADIDQGLALGSEQPEKAYFNRATAFEYLGDAASAARDYGKAAELRPDWPEAGAALARFAPARASGPPTP